MSLSFRTYSPLHCLCLWKINPKSRKYVRIAIFIIHYDLLSNGSFRLSGSKVKRKDQQTALLSLIYISFYGGESLPCRLSHTHTHRSTHIKLYISWPQQWQLINKLLLKKTMHFVSPEKGKSYNQKGRQEHVLGRMWRNMESPHALLVEI